MVEVFDAHLAARAAPPRADVPALPPIPFLAGPEPLVSSLHVAQALLAEVIDSDRTIEAMRRTHVIDLATVKLRRERVRAAERSYGHRLRGDGNQHA